MPRALKFALSSLLIGLMSVGLAYAGAILNPGGALSGPAAPASPRLAAQETVAGLESTSVSETPVAGPGQVLAGAAKANIAPRPEDFGGVWRTEGCDALGPGIVNAHPTSFRIRWAESSNCIYAGGNGIGPMNAITRFDEEYGLWARSVVVNDNEQSLIMTILDGAYYFGEYNNMCGNTNVPENAEDADPAAIDPSAVVDDPKNDCGFFDIQRDMGQELNVDPSSFMLASSHAHASPDFVGAWGGVPQWYMDQVEAAIKSSIRAAWAMRRPAVIEVGDELARQFNNERRDAYRSAEENSLAWFRLVELGSPTPDQAIDYDAEGNFTYIQPGTSETVATQARVAIPTTKGGVSASNPNGCDKGKPQCATPSPTPTSTPTSTPKPDPTEPPPPTYRAIATVGSYAGHPASGVSGGRAHPDWVGGFDKNVEQEFGGVGLMFESGLGNMSERSDTENGLARLLPDLLGGDILENPNGPIEVWTQQTFWNQPVTNTVLAGGGISGVFDRPMNQTPAAVRAGKNPAEQCVSASPISVRTAASAAKIGSLWVTGGPGELFSNLTNTIKEKNPEGVTMPLALVNDALGYIMQSFETDHTGRQGGGFAGSPVGIEYEDAYSIDHCFGDMVLEVTLKMLGVGDAQWVSVPPSL